MALTNTSNHQIMLLLLVLLHLSIHFSSYTTVEAAPIQAPDLLTCQPAVGTSPGSPNQRQVLDCCLPATDEANIKEFSFKDYPVARNKVRRPAHKAPAKYIEKYNRAYERMRALPPDDPRSLSMQANTHCAFCNGAYKQKDTNITLQVHFSWLFLPWHRWFLYFHERILGSLIGDPDFALLYWNWDNQLHGANTMPPFFAINGTAVYDTNRNQANLPPSLVRLRPAATTILSDHNIIKENLNVMYQSVVTASTADMFMGGAYSAGTDFSNVTVTDAPLAGALELNSHSGIHFWTGDPRAELRGDMGVFTTAGRDPIFYAHHSNIDRLWDVWKSISGGRRRNPTHKDFLDAEFVFYDENVNLVKVKVRDALDNKKLGIKYKKAKKGDSQWLHFEPLPVSNGSQVSYARKHGAKEINAVSQGSSMKYELGSRFTALVKRPSCKKGDGHEEVLLIQGLEVVREAYVHLQVFINLPQANAFTPIYSAEYLGSANIVPKHGSFKQLTTNVMLEIGDNIKRIGIGNEEWVVITLVVQWDPLMSPGVITFQGMEIRYH